ncbi:hypothetical protein [Pseudonocardia sp. EV170527-09]|uniref:hypothetical protein n=1 Tax=Pseudonocardia sp. EV170527-09 TaxID=2603411 RepID=UPI0018783D86|nr:hypothetical protein [Pseudonocardia sp. EV170527-09]
MPASGARYAPTLGSVTYREADEITGQVAHALAAAGLEPGARVPLFSENSVEAHLAPAADRAGSGTSAAPPSTPMNRQPHVVEVQRELLLRQHRRHDDRTLLDLFPDLGRDPQDGAGQLPNTSARWRTGLTAPT